MTETARLDALQKTELLDTLPEERFDRLTRLAKRALGAEVALISLIDSDRQWFKSNTGLDATETERSVAFCDHAIRTPDEVMVVPDATVDERFVDNPLVTQEGGIQFYAGAPLVTEDGHALGTLCVIDSKPRPDFDAEDSEMLRDLARTVMIEIELADREREIEDLSIINDELKHRMGNMYAHVGSMVSLLGRASDDDKKTFVRKLREQITTFGQTQALLAANQYKSVAVGDLIDGILDPFIPAAGKERITFSCDTKFDVSSRGAFMLTLLLSELATNAAKHGALHGKDGLVHVDISYADEIIMTWTESASTAASINLDEHAGFGSRILTQIAPRGVGGTATFEPSDDGLVYTLTADPKMLLAA